MDKDSARRWRTVLSTVGLSYLGFLLFGRPLINFVSDRITKRFMTDPYHENMWEFISAGTRAGFQTIVETNLRSQKGNLIGRPLGTPKSFPSMDDLMFNIAQLAIQPTPENVQVDMRVTIGPQAKRPLRIAIPIIISGMAYGIGLTEKAKIALARGAALAGTAINNGEGPFLPSERKAAKYYILLYDRGGRNHDPAIVRQADAVEIQFGQGALAGIGHSTPYQGIPKKARKLLHLKPGQPEYTHAWVPGITEPRRDLPPLVKKLREITDGVPIGAKIGVGHYLEKDLEILLEAGVDFISLDGAQAATKGSPPILQDDFGVPTVFAINRAANYLKEQGMKDKISLIAGGGLYTPGSFLKALALGADAVYIGSIALFAMAHTQVLKTMPFEPPPSIVFADSKQSWRFNPKLGATHLANFLQSCKKEMMEGIRALGKTSVKEVDKSDLRALSFLMAETLDIPLISKSIFEVEKQSLDEMEDDL